MKLPLIHQATRKGVQEACLQTIRSILSERKVRQRVIEEKKRVLVAIKGNGSDTEYTIRKRTLRGHRGTEPGFTLQCLPYPETF